MKPSIKIEGLPDTIKSLVNLGDAAKNRIVRNHARAGATEARKLLRAAAPRGSERSTASKTYGQLHKNIKMHQHRVGGKFVPYYKVTTGDAFWGGFLDQGTKHISATYWWVKAVEQMRGQVTRAMVEGIQRSLLREVEKSK